MGEARRRGVRDAHLVGVHTALVEVSLEVDGVIRQGDLGREGTVHLHDSAGITISATGHSRLKRLA